MSHNEFSVIQFFEDDSYEKVRTFVSATEAATAFNHYTNNVASRIGITARVIITDGGDCIVKEWKAGPPQQIFPKEPKMITIHWIDPDNCTGDSERTSEFTTEEEATALEAFLDVEGSKHWREAKE
jgi:hypothetical protein